MTVMSDDFILTGTLLSVLMAKGSCSFTAALQTVQMKHAICNLAACYKSVCESIVVVIHDYYTQTTLSVPQCLLGSW